MKAALHRIVHAACIDDDLLPSLSRGFTRSLFVLFSTTSATLGLASKLGIAGRDPLSFLTVRHRNWQIYGLLTQLVLGRGDSSLRVPRALLRHARAPRLRAARVAVVRDV